ncbi:ATP-dependent DNA helicase PIF1-like protein [Tanacetum coccineum]
MVTLRFLSSSVDFDCLTKEDGYHEQIPYHTNKGKRKTARDYVTMKEYYAYIIQYKKNHLTTLHRGGRLFQQYLIDAFTAIEEQRLSWTQNNQDTLHVVLYHNVVDSITKGDTDAAGLGKRIMLPISFTGGPRCKASTDIDDIILAELPSPTTDPIGYKAVLDYMLHGPCGKDNRAATACFAYGLLNDDKEQTWAIQEASLWALGPQLRDLFVTILLFCDVSRPLKPWEENWEVLSDDILHKKRLLFKYPELQLTTEQIQNYCLMEIQDLLNTNGRALSEFTDMPQPNPALLTSVDNRLIREAQAFDMNKSRIQHQELYPKLNPEQRLIYDEVVDSVHNKKGQFHFVYGPGGTGKTFLYKTIISRLRLELKIVLAVASSGIASLLLPGGRTAHSRFVIPLELLENSNCGIKQNTHLAELMKQVELIIWDEAPMTQKYAFKALDKTLRDILGYLVPDKWNKIFGGMTVLLGGDLRQILPIEILETFLIPSSDSPIQQIVEETYPNFIQRQKDDAYLRERAILTPRNADADAINAYMFDKLADPNGLKILMKEDSDKELKNRTRNIVYKEAFDYLT